MHNLSVVINFEFLRTLKKKSFWLSALAFPVLLGLVFAVIFLSADSAERATRQAAEQPFSFVLLDQSGITDPAILEQQDIQTVESTQQGIELVSSGQTEAFFYYPQDITQQPIRIYAQDTGLTGNDRYQVVATQILQQAAIQSINDPAKVAIVQDRLATTLTTYKDGQVVPGFERVIAPGLFLLLFYIVMALLSNRMLASTTEEKENRVIEMILTTVSAKTLILGKILAMVLIGLVQIAVIVIPITVLFLAYGQQLNLPSVDMSNISLTLTQFVIGLAAFIGGFFLMTGCLVAIGAAVPTAKEASNFFAVVIVVMIIPLYALMAIVTAPDQLLVQVMTYLPLTSPITIMLRNAVDNIPVWQAAISLGILGLSSLAALFTAARIFGFGTLEYSRKLSLKEIFTSR